MATPAAVAPRAPSPPATAAASASSNGDIDDEMCTLHEANALLEKVGFGSRKFDKYEDLVASVSSMSVALYEKLFQFRLEHIVRVPKSLVHYEANAQLVVDALSGALLEQRFDVRDVTGESLCSGDARSIQQIVRMFEQIFSILEEANSRGEQVHFATPPRSSASVLSENRNMSMRQSVKLKPAKKLTKKIKKKTMSPKSNMDSDSEDGSENEAIHQHRSSRRFQKAEQIASGLLRARNLTGDVNLYETSDASITRSRGGRTELSAARSKGRTANAATTTVATTRRTRPERAQDRTSGSVDAAVTIKKRSRRLNRSSESSPQHQHNHKDKDTAAEQTTRTKPARSKMPKKSAKNHQIDPNLLETQKYGRFVPVARNNAGGSESDNEDDSEAAFGGEQMYFGGVSSVSSGGSGSEKSVHFIEEDDEVSRDFASIIDEQNVPPNANLLSPSNAYDDVDGNVRPRQSEAAASVRELNKNRTKVMKKSTNQEEEEEGDEFKKADPVGNPPGPKAAPRHQPNSAPEQPIGSRVINRKEKDSAMSTLYPLLPRGGNAATSKSQTEFIRYKLYLKDHLQDLRQREYCQRQHLERAYKVGEHNANVEKIRARRFQQDIRLQRISIGLEARSEEEKHLRHTLTHILQLEKEKLRDEHRTTSSVLKQIQKDHAERENAMETLYILDVLGWYSYSLCYANQIQLVKEQTHREVKERELVEKAHRLASEQMIREMRKEREHQIAALLQEKQHLEEARRFRTATELSGALQREDEVSTRTSQTRVDAFYTAAMKARQLNAYHGGKSAPTAASKKRGKQAAAAYSSGRPALLSRRVK